METTTCPSCLYLHSLAELLLFFPSVIQLVIRGLGNAPAVSSPVLCNDRKQDLWSDFWSTARTTTPNWNDRFQMMQQQITVKKTKKNCTITACGPRNESHRCVINIFFFLFLKCGFTLRLFCLLNNRFWTNGICFFFYIFFWVISYFNSPICCAICAPHSLFCFLLDQHTSWQPYSLKPK